MRIAPAILLAAVMLLPACAGQEAIGVTTPPTPPFNEGTSFPPPPDTGLAAVGEWATADDGVAMRVSKLTRSRVGPYAAGATPGKPAVIVTVQFRNGGTERFDLSLVIVSARLGKEGREVEEYFDSDSGDHPTGTLLVGRTSTSRYGFAAVSAAELKTVSVELQAGPEYASAVVEGGL